MTVNYNLLSASLQLVLCPDQRPELDSYTRANKTESMEIRKITLASS